MLRYIEASSAAQRLDAAYSFLADRGPATEVLLIGVQRDAVDDVCRALTHGSRATFGLHRFTLLQYAARAASSRLASRGLAPGTPLGTEAVAARAIFEAARAGALHYFAPMVGCPGFPRALAATLGELRQARVGPESLERLGTAGRDLAVLLREHVSQLEHARVADRAMLLLEAEEALRAREPQTLAGLPVLLIDVALRTQAEQVLVRRLVETAPSALATIPSGDLATRSFISRLGEPIGSTSSAQHRSAQHQGGLARVRERLFAEISFPAPEQQNDEVQLFSAPGEGREAIEVARRILAEARRGVPLDEMAVVVRLPETYWGLLEHAFQRAGIRAWFSRGTRRPDPTGRAFLALLACAAEGLSARRFAEYLSLGQVPVLDPDGTPPETPPPWVPPIEETLTPGQLSLFDVLDSSTTGEAAPYRERKRGQPSFSGTDAAENEDSSRFPDKEPSEWAGTLRAPRHWEALIVESSVIGGADRWERRLRGLGEELELRLSEEMANEGDSPRAAALRRDRAHLDALQRFALPIIRALAAWPEQARWGEWLPRLEALAPRVLRHPLRVLEVLAELRPMAAVGPVSLDEVRAVLLPHLAALDREPPSRRYGRVFVCTPAQLRSRSFRILFVMGLAERIFPHKPRQDPLLLDSVRHRLDARLETQDDRVQGERLLLQLSVGAARERLYVSYPRLDLAQSRPRVPSFYALDLVRALTGQVPDYEQLERDIAQTSAAWLVWPAPDEPAIAIDEAEHDLAVLRPLLKPGHSALRGRASYLLRLNPWLAESLRMRWARWKRPWSRYDGLVAPSDTVRTLLAAERLGARPYSTSALQRFSACPYQFLLGAIHRFEPFHVPQPLERLDPLTRGALFHEVQRDVLRRLKARDLMPLSDAAADTARDVLDQTLDEVAHRYRDRLAPAIARVWQDEVEHLRLDLRTWLAMLVDSAATWEPSYFELSFGLPLDRAHDPASIREAVSVDGRFSIRGAVDLIERRVGRPGLRVTDHKTGKSPSSTWLVVGGGATLQPVIYGMVIEHVLQQPVLESRLFFATAQGGFSTHALTLTDDVRRAGIEVLDIIDRAVERGCFPAAPREKACRWCDFRPVCGPSEEQRFRRKDRSDASAVGDLLELRRMK
ncbi:MAG: PD-(D/E)XK nuclease family protein [Luteitalea sp.]|nr:PD-(D/E)XK nuclease family protein [Luteitalea sp.]